MGWVLLGVETLEDQLQRNILLSPTKILMQDFLMKTENQVISLSLSLCLCLSVSLSLSIFFVIVQKTWLNILLNVSVSYFYSQNYKIHFSVPMDLESDEESKPENGENGSEEKEERSHVMEELWIEGVKLPPEPPGNCSRDLQVT